jgi:hypothetical protein
MFHKMGVSALHRKTPTGRAFSVRKDIIPKGWELQIPFFNHFPVNQPIVSAIDSRRTRTIACA